MILIFACINISHVSGQVRCPNGYHRAADGSCEKVSDSLPTGPIVCPNGNAVTVAGDCERISEPSPAQQCVTKFEESPNKTESLSTYDNPLFDFKFQYPSEWNITKYETSNQVGFGFNNICFDPTVTTTLSVSQFSLKNNMTLKEYLRSIIQDEKNVYMPDLKFNYTKLAGLPAINASWFLSGTFVNDKPTGIVMDVFTIKDKYAYEIRLETNTSLLNPLQPGLKKVIDSFEIPS